MATSLGSLLKTVKSVEDESSRGIRALESAVEAITKEMAASGATAAATEATVATNQQPAADPDALLRNIMPITRAVTSLTSAINSADQVCGALHVSAPALALRPRVQPIRELCTSNLAPLFNCARIHATLPQELHWPWLPSPSA